MRVRKVATLTTGIDTVLISTLEQVYFGPGIGSAFRHNVGMSLDEIGGVSNRMA